MTRRALLILSVLPGLLLPLAGYGYPPLQLYISLTPEGGVLKLEPGTYSGPAVVDRAITIDGGGRATVDAEGGGTVLTIKADKAVVRGLHLTGSGDSHDKIDAGLLIDGANDVVVENNRIDDVLFGIHLQKAYDNIVRNNRVSSRDEAPTLRGEGLRLWNSSDNRIEGNYFDGVRDLFITNSPDNDIVGNEIRNSRVAMEFIFSPGNRVEGNTIRENDRGIVVIYSDELKIRNNRLSHMRQYAGSALSLKESSRVIVEGNKILHCAVGLTANSPIHPENVFQLRGNHFAYNDIGLYFYGEKGGHVIHDNRFEHNLMPVAVSAPSSALLHDWKGNYWDDYQGFDLDRDGIGDVPHEVYLYSDRIWMDRPMARFYRGSPLMGVIDLVERLLAFSAPRLILRDPAPSVK